MKFYLELLELCNCVRNPGGNEKYEFILLSAALFFGVYDTTKERLNGLFGAKYQTGAYAIASIPGELVSPSLIPFKSSLRPFGSC